MSTKIPTASMVAAFAAATIGVSGMPTAASAAVSHRGSCDHSKGKVLLQSRQAKVFRAGGSLQACAFGRNRIYFVGTAGSCFPESSCGTRQVTIVGRYVAYAAFAYGEDVTTRTVGVLNTVTGKLSTGAASDPSTPSNRDGSITDLVLSATGQVAWIYRTARTEPSYEVHVGSSIVDRSPTVVAGSLAIAGSIAYWTRGGAPQSATGSALE
jgi:hypothetical protein